MAFDFFFPLFLVSMISCLLSWCGGLCVGGPLLLLAFTVVGWGCYSWFFVLFCFPPLLQPPGSVLGDGGARLGGGGRVLGQAFRVTQRPRGLGRSDWEPYSGPGPGPLAGPDCQAWV